MDAMTIEPSLRVVSPREAAAILSLSTVTLQRKRNDGSGPLFVRLGERRVGYRIADLEAWLASRVSSSGRHQIVAGRFAA
jgi:predicted DNA-binding transcriptional regulator AlpA